MSGKPTQFCVQYRGPIAPQFLANACVMQDAEILIGLKSLY